jgi:hypothetical protein
MQMLSIYVYIVVTVRQMQATRCWQIQVWGQLNLWSVRAAGGGVQQKVIWKPIVEVPHHVSTHDGGDPSNCAWSEFYALKLERASRGVGLVTVNSPSHQCRFRPGLYDIWHHLQIFWLFHLKKGILFLFLRICLDSVGIPKISPSVIFGVAR